MASPANINPRIIEALYCEGLALSDEVRAMFSFADHGDRGPEDAGRIALSCEALRTTTRMMHAIAWLLNHRAFFRGEISEFQLRRYGRLQTDFPTADPERLALLSPQVCELIGATERFHARLARLETGWRERESSPVPAIRRLRDRLGGIVG
ncbi:DUF1465 family protein [Novosphingobium sp. TH158]|uniref:DUF1465 family protein n=1 Tax=Novosphingobium sp. TH158 TaxID=2067455 RepID=UPI000C7A525E|nr:DUF1465 family protein [Novosphingobium sp. TH158]PLK26896.1 DUF1465 domain-containing protein [Novosphingobium sp. TH158]